MNIAHAFTLFTDFFLYHLRKRQLKIFQCIFEFLNNSIIFRKKLLFLCLFLKNIFKRNNYGEKGSTAIAEGLEKLENLQKLGLYLDS